ncbi:hypothetical protein LZ30DRAFT_379863 [Colletotrichum cereale]|nr:hypothetical protein LZ30DRAFT_379863 [Colletotrichum cereale]
MDRRACPRPEGAFSFAAQPRCPERPRLYQEYQDFWRPPRPILPRHPVPVDSLFSLLRLSSRAQKVVWKPLVLVPPPLIHIHIRRALCLPLTCSFHPATHPLTNQLSFSHHQHFRRLTLTFTSLTVAPGKPAPEKKTTATTASTTGYGPDLRYLCGNTTPIHHLWRRRS